MSELELEDGTRASILETDGDRVVLRAEKPAPPGASLKLKFVGEIGSYQVKVRGSRRVQDESGTHFRIEGRWVNLTRAQRERVCSVTSQ
jgi:hypothetical protein